MTTTTARLPLRADVPERVGVRVLGSGLAGCAALLAVAEAGRSAVMLEKTDAIGGSTVKSGALLAFSGTDEQQAQGITDSVDLLRKDLLEAGQHRNDEMLVDLYCGQQLDTYQWLRSHGVVYGAEVHAGSGQSVPRSHQTDTTAMVVRLLEAAGQSGARLLLRPRPSAWCTNRDGSWAPTCGWRTVANGACWPTGGRSPRGDSPRMRSC